jgi:drug/metabolite transporter (DMT)-like permease
MSRFATTPARAPGRGVLWGILLMVLSIFVLSLMDVCAKWLSAELPVTQISWARYFGHLAIMTVLLWPRRGAALLRTGRPKLQIFRSLLLLACTLLFFTAIGYMPLADAVAVSFVSPLLVTALSVPLLSEKVGLRRWAAVAIGFAGAMVVIRPGLGVMHWAAGLVLVMALAFALYQITTRMLSETEDPTTTLFYSALVGTVVLTAVVPFQWHAPGSALSWALMGTLGVLGGVGHFMLIKAHNLAPVAVLAPLMYLALPWNTLFGLVFFGDFPDFWTLAGAGILIATGIYILYREGVQARDQARGG